MKKPAPTQSQQAHSGERFYTLTPVTPPEGSAASGVQPVYIRLPKSGKLCPYTGLSRSKMNQLILGKNPPVKSSCLRDSHAVRGTRLVNLGSLLAYIESMATSQNVDTKNQNTD